MANIIGTADDDVLEGTNKGDVFDGLDGSDTFLIGPDSGFDTFADTGLSGWDSVLAQSADDFIRLASGFGPASGIEEIGSGGFSDVIIQGGAGSDTFDFSATVLTGITSIQGGLGSDTVIGSAGADIIGGNNGNDTLMGGAGDDRLMGGAGNDFDPAEDLQHGRDGIDHLDGGAGNDALGGGENTDTLLGGTGNDILQGGRGADTLTGGPDADTFRYAATTEGGDLIADFEQGTDRIDLSLIDARTGSAKNDAFVFGGQVPGLQRYSVTVWTQNDVTTVSMDVTGDRVADMVLTLAGSLTLTAADFIL